ncbi:MAG: flagellar hook-length control protein FliK [Thermaurantiacus sp.]
MLPGFAIADMLFAASAPGRGESARSASDGAADAADFDALLEGTQEQQPKAVRPGATSSEGGGGKSGDNTGQAAGDRAVGDEAPRPSGETALPVAGNWDIDLPGSGGADSDAVSGMTADEAAPEIPASGDDAASGDDDAPAPAPEASDAVAAAPAEQPAVTPVAAVPVTGNAQTDASGAVTSGPADPVPATGIPADAAPPAAPGKDSAPDTGNKQDAPSGALPAKDSLPAKATPDAQPQAQAQPAPAPAAQAGPAPADTGQAAGQPAASGTPGAAGPAEVRAEAMNQPARADGQVPDADGVRRELDRGAPRDGESLANARKSADKSDTAAAGKDAPAAQRIAAAPPSPAPASAASAPQSFPAMLTALQSGLAAPMTPDAMQTGESGEIRLESGAILPARSESSNAQAPRSGTSMTQMRMASGHVAELGQMIARRFADGSRSFDIRLDPPELGRVQVRLEIGADRSVQAMLTADKPEALAELQRHARELEKALADAGLDLGENGIGFALSEGTEDDGRDTGQEPGGPVPAHERAMTITDNSAPVPVSRYGFLMAGRTGVDMRI